MGHSEQHLLTAFAKNANPLTPEQLGDIIDNPSRFDRETQQFFSSLNKLRSSEAGPNSQWKQSTYVHAAYRLIKDDYGDEKDHSGAAMILHPMDVADDSFRLARLFGFTNKEATVVWIAALCHDYLERYKKGLGLEERREKLRTLFDSLDPDVLNLDDILTNLDKERPYFIYVQGIGADMSRFSRKSTSKAQLATWIIKMCDSLHNSRQDRNLFLDTETARAQILMGSVIESDRQEGQEVMGKVERKRVKVAMYGMNIAFIAQKMKGWLKLEDGLPANATMVDFLLSDAGIGYRINNYKLAREVGLGTAENNRFLDEIDRQDAANERELVIDARSLSSTRRQSSQGGGLSQAA